MAVSRRGMADADDMQAQFHIAGEHLIHEAAAVAKDVGRRASIAGRRASIAAAEAASQAASIAASKAARRLSTFPAGRRLNEAGERAKDMANSMLRRRRDRIDDERAVKAWIERTAVAGQPLSTLKIVTAFNNEFRGATDRLMTEKRMNTILKRVAGSGSGGAGKRGPVELSRDAWILAPTREQALSPVRGSSFNAIRGRARFSIARLLDRRSARDAADTNDELFMNGNVRMLKENKLLAAQREQLEARRVSELAAAESAGRRRAEEKQEEKKPEDFEEKESDSHAWKAGDVSDLDGLKQAVSAGKVRRIAAKSLFVLAETLNVDVSGAGGKSKHQLAVAIINGAEGRAVRPSVRKRGDPFKAERDPFTRRKSRLTMRAEQEKAIKNLVAARLAADEVRLVRTRRVQTQRPTQSSVEPPELTHGDGSRGLVHSEKQGLSSSPHRTTHRKRPSQRPAVHNIEDRQRSKLLESLNELHGVIKSHIHERATAVKAQAEAEAEEHGRRGGSLSAHRTTFDKDGVAVTLTLVDKEREAVVEMEQSVVQQLDLLREAIDERRNFEQTRSARPSIGAGTKTRKTLNVVSADSLVGEDADTDTSPTENNRIGAPPSLLITAGADDDGQKQLGGDAQRATAAQDSTKSTPPTEVVAVKTSESSSGSGPVSMVPSWVKNALSRAKDEGQRPSSQKRYGRTPDGRARKDAAESDPPTVRSAPSSPSRVPEEAGEEAEAGGADINLRKRRGGDGVAEPAAAPAGWGDTPRMEEEEEDAEAPQESGALGGDGTQRSGDEDGQLDRTLDAHGALLSELSELIKQEQQLKQPLENQAEWLGVAMRHMVSAEEALHAASAAATMCPNGCGEPLPVEAVRRHCEEECVYRLAPCPDGCGLSVAVSRMEKHLATFCPHRLVRCRVKCGEKIMLKDRERHEAALCPQLLSCGPCGIMMSRKELKKHRRSTCPHRSVPCRLGCGRKLQKSKLPPHELEECPHRVATCRYCAKNMRICDLPEHEGESCGERRVACTACAERVKRKDLESHRAQVCPMQRWKCEECGTDMFRKDKKMHLTYCRGCSCVQCGLGFPDRQARLQHEKTECPLRAWSCETCDQKMLARDKSKHRGKCPEKPVSCDVCAAEYKLKDESRHKLHDCAVPFQRCGLGCDALVASADRDEHETKTCPRRLLMCSRCGAGMKAACIARHQRSSCRLIQCKCESWVLVRDQERHTQAECPLRRELCRLGCGLELPESRRIAHESQECGLRVTVCNECGEVLKASVVQSHLRDECRRREMPCPDCGLALPESDIARHQTWECAKNFWHCPCGEVVPRVGSGRRAHLQSSCWKFKKVWRDMIEKAQHSIPSSQIARRLVRIANVATWTEPGVHFCALVECGGKWQHAIEKLRDATFVEDMGLVAELLQVDRIVERLMTKKVRKKKEDAFSSRPIPTTAAASRANDENETDNGTVDPTPPNSGSKASARKKRRKKRRRKKREEEASSAVV